MQGTFIINGAERVIVSQLVRSPGVYYAKTIDKTGKPLYATTVIPGRGAWLEYETDSNDVMWVRIDRTRKLPMTVLLRAMGYGTDDEIIVTCGETPDRTPAVRRLERRYHQELRWKPVCIEIYKKLRPGEPPTVDSRQYPDQRSLFFDPKRYDLAKVGRYKFNKKLALAARIAGQASRRRTSCIPRPARFWLPRARPSPASWPIRFSGAGVNCVVLHTENERGSFDIKVIGNNFADAYRLPEFRSRRRGHYREGARSHPHSA